MQLIQDLHFTLMIIKNKTLCDSLAQLSEDTWSFWARRGEGQKGGERNKRVSGQGKEKDLCLDATIVMYCVLQK